MTTSKDKVLKSLRDLKSELNNAAPSREIPKSDFDNQRIKTKTFVTGDTNKYILSNEDLDIDHDAIWESIDKDNYFDVRIRQDVLSFHQVTIQEVKDAIDIIKIKIREKGEHSYMSKDTYDNVVKEQNKKIKQKYLDTIMKWLEKLANDEDTPELKESDFGPVTSFPQKIITFLQDVFDQIN
jgi:hypothetical protein